MPIGKIERKKSYMLIVEQIKHLLTSGELQVGEKLPPERELAEQFGVARPTVREALSALEVLGIIDVQVGSGAYIINLPQQSPSQLVQQIEAESHPVDLFEVRQAVEGLAAAKAAEQASEEDIARIREIVTRMERDVERNEFSLEQDRQFHLSIARASQNPHVVAIMTYIIAEMKKPLWQKYIIKNIDIEGHKAMYVRNHRMILSAIEANNPQQARALMLEHLQGGIVLEDWD
jgi:GntR family transcriptional repressor for pyruvate dehydrogenase complex